LSQRLDTKFHIARILAIKLRLGFALLLCSGTVLTLLPNSAYTAPLSVNVILSENSMLYKEFSDALTNGLVDSETTVKVFDTTQPQPEAKLIVAVGIKAANFAASSNAKYILNVMIPKSGHKKLLHDFPKRDNSNSYTSIYLDQPIERQLGLIAAAFPNRKQLGVMFDNATTSELNQLKQLAPDYGIDLYEKEVASPEAMFDTLQNVLQHSDVLLALPASAIYNSSTLRNILVSTYQSHTPLVGFSSSYVKAGAICAVFSTPTQLALQTSSTIKNFIETNTLPSAQHPTFYEISVNERVAQSMGIQINNPEELSKKMSIKRKPVP
jgi:putative tryptophan/tyrosine transport system substrate-binding protein